MTSPLPTPSKLSPAEGARSSIGNFFQTVSNDQNPYQSHSDFESCLTNSDPQEFSSETKLQKGFNQANLPFHLPADSSQSQMTPLPQLVLNSENVQLSVFPESLEFQGDPSEDRDFSVESRDDENLVYSAQILSEANQLGLFHTSTEVQQNYISFDFSTQSITSTTPVKTDSSTPSIPLQKSQEPLSTSPQTTDTPTPTEKNSKPDNLEAQEQLPSARTTSSNNLDINKQNITAHLSLPYSVQKTAAKKDEKSDGMKSAENKTAMISLTSIDDAQASVSTERDSVMTSAHRLNVFSSGDSPKIDLTPNNTSSNFNSSTDSSTAGLTANLESKHSHSSSPANQAAAIFKTLPPEFEKLQQSGRNNIQLDVQVSDQESVRIRLTLRAGELHSTIITESPELRDALQKSWPDFAQQSRDRGYRLSDPNFQQSFQNNDSAGENARRDRQAKENETFTFSDVAPSRKSTSTRSAETKTSTALWA
jgi:hypothetical protein